MAIVPGSVGVGDVQLSSLPPNNYHSQLYLFQFTYKIQKPEIPHWALVGCSMPLNNCSNCRVLHMPNASMGIGLGGMHTQYTIDNNII